MENQEHIQKVWFETAWTSFREASNLKAYNQVAILVDENTEKHCLPLFNELTSDITKLVIRIKSGEQEKNLESCRYIWEKFYQSGIGKNSVLINLGGGVITDIGGFCAQNYLRGIDFYNIPTTLLGMVDASLGGKTGIDFMHGKNVVGSFSFPEGVIIEPEFLQTLPYEQMLSGFAEIVKHAIIADAELFHKLESLPSLKSMNKEALNLLISRAIDIKMSIVGKDPFEKGEERKRLNFGHTIGHALESLSLKNGNVLLHGYAVAAGMIIESYVAWKLEMLSERDLYRISALNKSFFPAVNLDEINSGDMRYFLIRDKKNRNNEISFLLPDKIGSVRKEIYLSDLSILDEAIDYYTGFMKEV
jgi:3-dehydroquinate synthase